MAEAASAVDSLDQCVTVDASVSGGRCDLIIGSSGGEPVGTISLDFSGIGVEGLNHREVALVTAMAGITVGQASMAASIHLDADLDALERSAIDGLAGLHYDAHAYAQRLSAWSCPSVVTPSGSAARGDRPMASVDGHERRVVLLWSGGKDALASLRLLRANGFEVIGLHATANDAVRELEVVAARALASQEELELLEVPVEWPVLAQVLSVWSSSTGVFPLKNPVPHGRDLILLVAAAIVARRQGAGWVAAGYEFDLWDKRIPYLRKVVWRHDTQSREAGRLVDQLLRGSIGVGFFSPIAGITESLILEWLLNDEPESWNHIVSCFWGNWCGECRKCLRYSLRQEALGLGRIAFLSDPLKDRSPALEALVDSILDRATPYWEQQMSDLSTVLALGRIGDPEISAVLNEFQQFFTDTRPGMTAHLKTIRDSELAPPGFDLRHEGRMLRHSV